MLIAGRLALDSRQSEVLLEISDYQKRVDAGGKPIGEWDGPHRLWDHEDVLRLEVMALADALSELNRAATIAIYHHWERHVPNSKNRKLRDHSALLFDLGEAGIKVHPDIEALRFSANFLKHGNPRWIEKLHDGFPGEFPALGKVGGDNPVWWGTLDLSDEHVSWFFEIAKTSKRPILRTL